MSSPRRSSAAVIVLARSPRVEARLKKLGDGNLDAGRRFFDATLSRTLRAAREAGASDVHVAVAPEDRGALRRVLRGAARKFSQAGDSFGERIANAVSHAQACGYERVLLVAGDCPGLRTSHLRAALAALDGAAVVLGPSGDGGLHLLGLHACALAALNLRSLPWLTGDVAARIARAAHDGGLALAEVDRVDDVDGRSSARLALRGLLRRADRRAAAVAALLRDALVAVFVRRLAPAPAIASAAIDARVHGHRGPPRR